MFVIKLSKNGCVLKCLKNYVRSTMKNDRLSSLGLVHIHRDFELDLYKAMEVFISAKTRRADFGQYIVLILSQPVCSYYLMLCA
jgi:hypothetical protein